MKMFNLSNNNLDEVVFEQRNKAYGAYAMRKAYPGILNKSMFLAISPMLFIVLGALVWNYFRPIPILKYNYTTPAGQKMPNTTVITIGSGFTFILDDPLAGFTIVIDKKVKPIIRKKEVVKPIEKIITGITKPGLPSLPNMGGIGLLPSVGLGVPGGTGIGKGEPLIIDTHAERMPEFPGGTDALYDYIRKNLNYPRLAIESGVSGKVVVSFVIMPDGSVQMSNLERGIGFGCDDEAMRVINQMPGWLPAQQNGRNVPIRMFLPVVFQTIN